MQQEAVFDNNKTDKWIRPWEATKFDNMEETDERFFALVIKGALSYLSSHIVLYNKPIRHFILTTGSDYLYVESNGYNYNVGTVSGEDTLYSHLPRCNAEIG